jgi:hypothetical protein
MQYKDLIKGEIYIAPFNWSSSQKCRGVLFQYDEEGSACLKGPHISATGEYHSDGTYITDYKTKSHYEIPTEEEKRWLLACMREGKTISKEEALKHYCNYQIY